MKVHYVLVSLFCLTTLPASAAMADIDVTISGNSCHEGHRRLSGPSEHSPDFALMSDGSQRLVADSGLVYCTLPISATGYGKRRTVDVSINQTTSYTDCDLSGWRVAPDRYPLRDNIIRVDDRSSGSGGQTLTLTTSSDLVSASHLVLSCSFRGAGTRLTSIRYREQPR